MAHILSQGIISAAVLPFETNGAIDWKTLDHYIAEVAAGWANGNRDEHGRQRGLLAEL